MRLLNSRLATVGLALVLPVVDAASYADDLSTNSKSLFSEGMSWMDTYYDSKAGYLYNFDAASALRHETRSSVWYALGLLARNNGSDVDEAEKIITNVIEGQHKVPADQWYGDYQMYPEQPYVGSPAYSPSLYGTWDPNWRGFIGTTFIVALEEFPNLISDATQNLMLRSLYNATKGDEYRFGSLEPGSDNLFPAYSNPAIMRAFMSGWTGRRLNDYNMTKSGEKYAQEIIDLFDRDNTLSEFNSGTYTGVSLYGLVLWSKYLPSESVMTRTAPNMIEHTWEAVGQLWHPTMKNMAGPWDRAYGYDMNRYVSLMGLWFWTLIGKENSSMINKPQVMSHMADYAWAPVFAVLADYHKTLIPDDVLSSLSEFQGEHTFTASAYYPPYDNIARNITTWLSEKITIGAESYDEIVVGGPSMNPSAFNPAVVQWNTGSEISFISLYPTEEALAVEVSPGRLSLTYPYGDASSEFPLIVGTFVDRPTISSWEDLPGLKVSVSGNVNPAYTLTFGGSLGGSDSPIRDFEYWKFTYKMASNFTGPPRLVLGLTTL